MKKLTIIITIILFSMVSTNVAYSSDKGKKGFDKLKSLVGTWSSKMPDGSETTITYKIVSNGSVIMENISSKEDDNMITMYHLDDNNLMMTHYCSIGNQPRMKAEVNNDNFNELHFRFVDITNLKNKDDGYMSNLDIKFLDNDHLIHNWTFTKDGKNTVHTFNAERLK